MPRKSSSPASLRQRAEQLLRLAPRDVTALPAADVQALVYELQVHQMELQLQNEQLRTTQLELTVSRDRYTNLYDFAPVGYITVSLDGIVCEANLIVASMLGVERTQLLGAKLSSFVHRDDQDTWYLHRRQVADAKASQRCELRLCPVQGQPVVVQLDSCRNIMDQTAPPTFATALTDISRLKQMEQERETLIAELEARAAELEQFIGALAHTLNDPLIALEGFAMFLQQDALQGDTRHLADDVKQIDTAIHRLKDVVDQLMQLGQVSHLTQETTTMPLHAMVDDCLRVLVDRIASCGALIKVDHNLPMIHGVRGHLFQVLWHLLDNALKFSGPAPLPRIHIGARHESNRMVYYVQDHGLGIDPAHHQRIFDLFFRLDRSIPGHGIGLALAKRVITAHGGRIWVQSDGLGKGTCVCFTVRSM